jgi:hypothetical protein
MFKNDRLRIEGFQHDRLLLNAAAWLTHGEEVAALQARHRARRGFGFQTPARRAAWRTVTVVAGPGVILLVGLALRLGRRRPRGGRA